MKSSGNVIGLDVPPRNTVDLLFILSYTSLPAMEFKEIKCKQGIKQNESNVPRLTRKQDQKKRSFVEV